MRKGLLISIMRRWRCKMGIDKNCRYCGAERVRSDCGGYVVCMCEYAEKEWLLSMEKESLKKRIVEISKEISNMKENHSQNVQEASK